MSEIIEKEFDVYCVKESDLVKKLESEIKQLKEKLEFITNAKIEQHFEVKRLQEENEQLRSRNETLKSNIGSMNIGAVLELQGVKEKTGTIVSELKTKGFDKPKGFSVLEGYVEDRLSEIQEVGK